MEAHEIVFITEANANVIDGVRKVPYMKPRPTSQETHIAARELDAAVRRAEIVAHTANSLKQLDFIPDIVIGHQGWGEMLNLPDVFPGVPEIGYMEVLARNLKVMDATAISLCMENRLPIVVFNLRDKDNMRRVVLGEPVGTIVRG